MRSSKKMALERDENLQPMSELPETTIPTEFHVRLVEREVNARLGGDVTVRDLVRLMLDLGWSAPHVAGVGPAHREEHNP